MLADELASRWVKRFRRNLRRWYSGHGRELPWRGERDPYRVWVREIMLQQTTVAAVVPYLDRFLERFPRLQDLAAAEVSEVLRAWEGLGYYSRARNLQAAASQLVGEHGGCWPEDPAALKRLPGIGPYTAAAIASFAFDIPAAIVEANTLRLYARLLGLTDDPRKGSGQAEVWRFAQRVVPPVRPGEFNQALMDLGATVCTWKPQCPACPVRSCCEAWRRGEVERIPTPSSRPAVTDLHQAAIVLRRGDSVLLVQHPSGQRWAGLWGFPRFDRGGTGSWNASDERLIRGELAGWGVVVGDCEPLVEMRHGVTRFRIHLQVVTADWESGDPADRAGVTCWQPLETISMRPLSAPARKIVRSLVP